MNKSLSFVSLFVLCFLFGKRVSYSQINVVSANGYVVNIIVQPRTIVPSSGSCQWGYNYNVRMDYAVTFSGTNIPSSLYTLQGTLGCGSSSHFFSLPVASGIGTLTTQSNVWRSISDCATSTISSLACNTVNLTINGPGISNRVITFVAASTSPLPIKLGSFTAEAKTGHVKITWSTVTEASNNHFTVERSTDGNSWTIIETITSAGNSTSLQSYTCTDENPVAGKAYYRLKQTDIDGKITYSDTRVVNFSSVKSINIYPVPATGNTIHFNGIAEPKNISMKICDAAGVAMFSTTLSSTTAQLPNLKAGLYVIILNNKVTGETTNLRYIKI